jgi:hypothetical protein
MAIIGKQGGYRKSSKKAFADELESLKVPGPAGRGRTETGGRGRVSELLHGFVKRLSGKWVGRRAGANFEPPVVRF